MATHELDEKPTAITADANAPVNTSETIYAIDSKDTPATDSVAVDPIAPTRSSTEPTETAIPDDKSMALVVAQPGPTPPLTIPALPLTTDEKYTPSESVDLEAQKKIDRKSAPRRSAPIPLKVLVTTGTVLKILFVYAIPGIILGSLALALTLGIPLSIVTGQCAATQVIGNSVLKAAGHSGYSTNAHAGAIGATGGAIAAFCLGILLQCIPDSCTQTRNNWGGQEPSNDYPWYITFFTSTLLSTLAGVIGCAILLHNHIDLGGYDILHAARAAAVGGIIYAVGMAFLGPVILMAIGIILSPLLIAMAFGAKWVYIRANDSWEQRGDWTYEKYSHCYCYGFCERDEEIDAELAKIGH